MDVTEKRASSPTCGKHTGWLALPGAYAWHRCYSPPWGMAALGDGDWEGQRRSAGRRAGHLCPVLAVAMSPVSLYKGALELSMRCLHVVKNLTWSKGRSGLCPQLLTGDLQAPEVSCPIRVFIYLRSWATQLWGEGGVLSVSPLEGLGQRQPRWCPCIYGTDPQYKLWAQRLR